MIHAIGLFIAGAGFIILTRDIARAIQAFQRWRRRLSVARNLQRVDALLNCDPFDPQGEHKWR
jgi:hypothetical protein